MRSVCLYPTQAKSRLEWGTRHPAPSTRTQKRKVPRFAFPAQARRWLARDDDSEMRKRIQSELTFDRHGDGVATAQAERGDAVVHIAADHFVDERHQHASAAGADGMADSDGATIHVDFLGIKIEFAK